MKTSSTMIKASLCCILWLSIMVAINASDPDPLQDFCVADTTQANVKINGFLSHIIQLSVPIGNENILDNDQSFPVLHFMAIYNGCH
ncbi:hypothetical protein SUGI_0368220 [Cryptomeria japonica]|nr:hypothetical protein SUGI_0368220 [Cryptomeria japonica]